MVDISSISRGASSGLLYDIHHIARSVLRLIGEDHRIAAQDEEASMSHGPSIRPPTSPTTVRMQLVRGRGRGRGHGRGRGRPGERGGCRLVVVLFVVPLMRLSCHPGIPYHPSRLPYHTSFHPPPRDFPSRCHPTIITHISSLRGHITIYDITYNIVSH